jgi:hypothetical protein
MASDSPQTRVDRAIAAMKNHPVTSVILVVALAIIALAQLTGAIETLSRFASERMGDGQVAGAPRAEYCQLLVPLVVQLDRTKSAFDRWDGQNLPLEHDIVRDGNIKARNLLEQHAGLIPPELQYDRQRLVEHYDRWLEEYSRLREGPGRLPGETFVFVGPAGFPFPTEAAARFRARLEAVRAQLGAHPNCE